LGNSDPTIGVLGKQQSAEKLPINYRQKYSQQLAYLENNSKAEKIINKILFRQSQLGNSKASIKAKKAVSNKRINFNFGLTYQ
jgi:hypothetical protein